MLDPIRVLTFNVKMLPSPIGNRQANERRAEAIVEDILRLDPPVDVVCLQEVFSEDVRRLLARLLRDELPFQVPKCHDTSWFSLDEDSGLFFASRFRIPRVRRRLRHGFREFLNTAPLTSDYFTDKGIFGAELDVSERWAEQPRLVVFHTHLQSDHTIRASHPRTRTLQLGECYHFMSRFLGAPSRLHEITSLLVGDLNVIAETIDAQGVMAPTREYQALRDGSLHGFDMWRRTHPEEPGFTWNGPANTRIPSGDIDRQRLDYVFGLDAVPGRPHNDPLLLNPVTCDAIELYAPRTARLGDLSDHYGVLASVRPQPGIHL